jgi:dihydropteroate synthase
MNYQLKLNNKLVDLSTPVVMGIVNLTPDSFFFGSRLTSDLSVLKTVEKFLENGATIIDVGGYSTRPGAEEISSEEEIKRLSDGLETILKKFPDTFISVDTFRSIVARHVIDNYNIAMINDISGGTLDNLMFETIADKKVAYVLMHMQGTPATMQTETNYDNIISEMMRFFEKRLSQLHLLGVTDVVIDPGFGFAKTLEQNYEILSKMHYFKELNAPILAGVSRKSMIYKLLDTDPENALNGTTAVNILALMGGASILRVHDVKEAIQTVKIFNQYKFNG